MKKISNFMLAGLSVLAAFTLFITSSSANEKTFVNISSYNSSTVNGNATKGSKVSVLLNNKKEVGNTYASKNNGNYKITLKGKLSNGSKLYVYAQTKNSLQKPYRIITLQKKTVNVKNTVQKNDKKTNSDKKSKSTSNSEKSSNSLAIKSIDGKWQSSKSKNNTYEVMNFDTKNGFQRDVFENNKLKNSLVKYAAYSYKHLSNNVFEFSYKAKNAKPLYMKFTSTNKFILSNDKNDFTKNVVYFSKTK
ncbi:Ig-like domain-containing protein [Apilactobacillus xinyiensis]|uniref:Ig-like domain-containing protein n=1 Tax=Apilactobacillus xinyiensis TaxID=2841032 RepID=A0ABT0I2N0_9LACO|nr:Ig-like domain-containing protein [Apilactobacillus xinyiensis]MCK8624990.1 Ig-like domain-containing protein [Apilactobacillus xinyiensis]MCL0330522.1 Ig-like domain-containing protein [Apilactobacillus xinyiensis]